MFELSIVLGLLLLTGLIFIGSNSEITYLKYEKLAKCKRDLPLMKKVIDDKLKETKLDYITEIDYKDLRKECKNLYKRKVIE